MNEDENKADLGTKKERTKSWLRNPSLQLGAIFPRVSEGLTTCSENDCSLIILMHSAAGSGLVEARATDFGGGSLHTSLRLLTDLRLDRQTFHIGRYESKSRNGFPNQVTAPAQVRY